MSATSCERDSASTEVGAERQRSPRASSGGLDTIRPVNLPPRADPDEQPPVEIGHFRDTEQADVALDFLAEDVERALGPFSAGGGHPVERGAADKHRVGAEHQRLQNVGAAPEAAIDDQRDPVADRAARLGQDVDRRHRPVELTSAMVRDRDRVGADLGGALDVAHRQKPLDDQLARPAVAYLRNRVPG